MMKNLTLGLFISAMVIFTGCSQKDVEVSEETTTNSQQDSTQTDSQTESSQTNSSMESSTTNSSDMSAETPMLDNIYFDYDKFTINSEMRSIVKANSSKIVDSKFTGDITLEGHCDERGSNEYNFALGLKRAQTVKTELVGYGVNPSQIKIISYGENQPLCTDKTQNCWSKNRRVEAIVK